MKRVKMLMHRYGEADFDNAYIGWGLHDRETQIKESESVLRLIGGDEKHKILDLACGIGRHAIYWAQHGHDITGVDISETFINRAREEAAREHAAVNFIVSDIRKLDIPSDFSVITWIEISLFDKDILEKIYRSLKKGGRFIVDARNPGHPKSKSRSGNWRTWCEDNGVFTLERHEINPATGKHEDVWITIDTENEIIEEKSNVPEEPGLKSLNKTIACLRNAGFNSFEVRTLEGELFNGGEEPYWLWVVAVK